MQGQRKFSNPAECLVAVLAAIDEVDPSNEYVSDITIWKFAEIAKASSEWGWSVSAGRVIDWDGKLREPHPDRQRQDTNRWRKQAIDVYNSVLEQVAKGEDRPFAKLA